MLEEVLSKTISSNSIVVIASGFDYDPIDAAPVDFSKAALNCLRRIQPDANSPSIGNKIILELAFAEGAICLHFFVDNVLHCEKFFCFEPPTSEDYQKSKRTTYFASVTHRTLSISDLYFTLLWVGQFCPGSITHIIIASHAWDNGPIFLNSYDPFPAIPWRSPFDKDGRIKDLVSPQLGAQEVYLIRRCFHPEAFAINLGCGGSANAKSIFRDKVESCAFSTEDLHTFDQSSSRCWNQLFANACFIPCYGAYPGFPTCFELDHKIPTLAVPQEKVFDRLDYSKLLIFLQQKLHLKLDPWGLGLVRFEPQESFITE
jgi:hypothetical protein